MNERQKNNLTGASPQEQSVRFLVDVNRHFTDKVKRPDMYAFNWTFQTEELTLEDLVDDIRSGHAFTAPFAKVKHDDKKTPRVKKNVLEVPFLALDVETGDKRSTLKWWKSHGLAALFGAVLYTTASHTDDDPRCRVVFLLDSPLDVDEAELALKAFHHKYDFVDQSAKDACRLFYGAEGCQVVTLGNVLPLDVLYEEVIQPYLDHLEEEQRQRDAERAKRPPRRRTTKANAGRWSGLIQYELDKHLSAVAGAVEGTGKRHKNLLKASVRLYSLKKADWLDDEARCLLDDLEERVLDAARTSGYVTKYGEQDTRQHIVSGKDLAQAADQPEALSDYFQPGDTVVATVPGHKAQGQVTAVKQDHDTGAWIYELSGVWWPRSTLRHAAVRTSDELDDSDELEGCEDDHDDETSAFFVMEDTSDAVSTGKPPPPPNWTDQPLASQERAADFFEQVEGQPALSVSTSEAGQEDEEETPPPRPKHTCKSGNLPGTEISIFIKRTTVTPYTDHDWRQCPGCRSAYVYRRTKAIETELKRHELTATTFDTVDDWKRTSNKWRTWKRRGKGKVDFTPFHQADGSVVVVHSSDHQDDKGEALPPDEEALLELVTTWCEQPSLEVRNRSSKGGFGGEWQGTRGHGQLKQAEREGKKKPDVWHLKVNTYVHRVARPALGITLNARNKGQRDIHCTDAYVAIRDWQDKERKEGRQVILEERHVHKADNEVVKTIMDSEVVQEVIGLYGPQNVKANACVSPLMSIEQEEVMDNKRDTSVVTQQQTLLFNTTSTLDEVEERDRPAPVILATEEGIKVV